MRESFARTGWVLLTPLVHLAHRLGWCGYEWVNLCVGARRRDLFDPLWHWHHFGTPIADLPEEVNLHGIGYRTSVAEGTVVFTEDFTRRRIIFARYPGDHVQWQAESVNAPAPHVVRAYAWIEAVFGGTHEQLRSTDAHPGATHA